MHNHDNTNARCTPIAVNTASGAIDAAAHDVAVKAITGQPQNLKDTAIAAGKGAVSAALFSTVTEGAIASNSMKVTTGFSNGNGVEAGIKIAQPGWADSAGVFGESVIPAIVETSKELYRQLKSTE